MCSCVVRKCLAAFGAVLLLGVVRPAWALLPVEHWTQPDGARVWLVQSAHLPMVDVEVAFDGGLRRDPAGQAGLAGAVALMTTKGLAAVPQQAGLPAQAALDETEVSDAWTDLGASFGATASRDALHYRLRSLTRPDLLDAAVQLGARHIAAPAWPDKVWERVRQSWSASLAEAATRPAVVAQRAFAGAVFGDHPYGAQATAQTLGAIALEDMRRFHGRSVRACQARVSIVGAVTREQAQELTRVLLARLPASADCADLPQVPEVQPLGAAADIRIPFTAAQAQVLLGQVGVPRRTDDHVALVVGNHILGGGGFTSRLVEAVREKRGLAYGVSSSFSPGLHAGAFTIALQTRPDQAQLALDISRQVLEDFVREGPTQAELRAAKDFLISGFALSIDSNAKLLANVAGIAGHDLPLDYLDTWTAQVEALTVADVHAAMQRALQPQRMVSVVLGGAQAADAEADTGAGAASGAGR